MSDQVPPSRAPKMGLVLMAVIVGAMALVAIHANIQKLRRGKTETVVVKPLLPPKDSGTATPNPTP